MSDYHCQTPPPSQQALKHSLEAKPESRKAALKNTNYSQLFILAQCNRSPPSFEWEVEVFGWSDGTCPEPKPTCRRFKQNHLNSLTTHLVDAIDADCLMKPQKWFRCNNPRVQSQWLSTIFPRYIYSRRDYSFARSQYKALTVVEDDNIDTFRAGFFLPEKPALLPRRLFREIPAYERWFHHSPTRPNTSQLNTEYLAAHGADALVPLELTQAQPQTPQCNGLESHSDLSFRKFHAPLSLFLQWIREAESQSESPSRLYLAQCQLLDLPQILRDDFPTPSIVAKAGKGDVYDTNVWIGHPPTYTPLHRDPNPNLFVQLAGRKIVRLLAPRDGQVIFSHVRGQLGRSGNREAAVFRGEEMMQGRERALLEQAVWDDAESKKIDRAYEGFEAELEAGDGLFIPKGWWHSIKGMGESVTASVSVLMVSFDSVADIIRSIGGSVDSPKHI